MLDTVRMLQSSDGVFIKTTERKLLEAITKVLRWRSPLQFGCMYNRLRFASTDEQFNKVVNYLKSH